MKTDISVRERGGQSWIFMQHPVFGGFKHMFFNVEDNVLKAIAPVKYKDFFKAQGREDNWMQPWNLSII
mgnify:CR=1 FL=1